MTIDEGRRSIQELVEEFYAMAGKPVRERAPVLLPGEEAAQISTLVDEESTELRNAAASDDMRAFVDALGDLAYVLYGAAAQLGFQLDDVIRRIHKSNMSKRNSDGSVVMREDGKVLRGDSYIGPEFDDILWPEEA